MEIDPLPCKTTT